MPNFFGFFAFLDLPGKGWDFEVMGEEVGN
jgi:hypothetical protein